MAKEQQWTVSFLNDSVTKEYQDFNDDLKDAFWNLHDKIRFYGLPTLSTKEAKRLSGTKDLWELRFKGKSGIGRGLYVQKTGRTIVVLVFFAKQSDKLPKRILDLAIERRKALEEGIVEALNEDRMAVKLIDAREVFEKDYPPGTPKRARIDAQIQVTLEKHGRKVRRMNGIKALPRKAKEQLARAFRSRATRQAAG